MDTNKRQLGESFEDYKKRRSEMNLKKENYLAGRVVVCVPSKKTMANIDAFKKEQQKRYDELAEILKPVREF
jgi:hypothetical protein